MCHQFKDYREFFHWKNRGKAAMDPLVLRYCDSGALFTLLSSLGKLECSKIHVKINEHFHRTTGAMGIIMERFDIPPTVKVRSIGRVQLHEVLVFKDRSEMFQIINRQKGPTRLHKGQLEGLLYCELDKVLKEEYNEKFSNSIFIPIEHPSEDGKYTFYVGLINFKDFKDCDDIYHGLVTEYFRYCFGALKSSSNYEEAKVNSNRCTVILNTFVDVLTSAGSKLLYDQVQKKSMEVFNATKCTVFLRDPEFVLIPKALATGRITSISVKETENLKKIYHTTTANKVVETGKLINIKVVQDDPLYSPDNDFFTGNCRSLLSFPLKFNGRLIGVIEVYDKNTPSLTFNEEDKEFTIPFSNAITFAMQGNHVFYNFMDTKTKQQFTDCVFLRRINVRGIIDSQRSQSDQVDDNEIIKRVLHCKNKHNFKRITDFRFDPTEVPEKHMLCVCLIIFEGSGLLKHFQIKRETFVRFLAKVKEAHMSLPFHNWKHAFMTFHFVFVCINQYNPIKQRFVAIFEYFTLLIAALCHCLDYRGPTTMFQRTTGTVMASLYSSPGSVNQLHHSSQALRLITLPECNFLQHIGEEEFYSFATLLIKMIKDTNFALYPKKIVELQEMIEGGYDANNEKHRRYFHYLILNCAQTCYACKSWPQCRKVGEETFKEFFRKGDLSYASGVFELPDFNEDILKLPEMNYNFIERICLPNFKILSQICPLVHLCVLKINANLLLWKEEKEKMMADMMKNIDEQEEDEEEEEEG